jgi:hypothetical protein
MIPNSQPGTVQEHNMMNPPKSSDLSKRIATNPFRDRVSRCARIVSITMAYGFAIAFCCVALVAAAPAADAQYSTNTPDEPLQEWLL